MFWYYIYIYITTIILLIQFHVLLIQFFSDLNSASEALFKSQNNSLPSNGLSYTFREIYFHIIANLPECDNFHLNKQNYVRFENKSKMLSTLIMMH